MGVARDEHEGVAACGVVGAARRDRQSGNFPAIVDRHRVDQLHVRADRNQRVQVNDRTILPKEGVHYTAITDEGLAHNLSTIVHGSRPTAAIAIYGSQVGRHAVLP
jgi:hypothetical protein